MDYQIMGFSFTTTQLIVTVVVLAVVILLAVGAYVQYRKTRTLALRSRFGSEYDRAIVRHGSALKAEAELADRETRVEALKIRELGVNERDRFIAEWQIIQSRFVDHPKAAVIEADDLVNELLAVRGYPRADFEQRAADLSVHHPRHVESYRFAHSIAVRHGHLEEATTEELRTAMIKYRAMFEDLIQDRRAASSMSAA